MTQEGRVKKRKYRGSDRPGCLRDSSAGLGSCWAAWHRRLGGGDHWSVLACDRAGRLLRSVLCVRDPYLQGLAGIDKACWARREPGLTYRWVEGTNMSHLSVLEREGGLQAGAPKNRCGQSAVFARKSGRAKSTKLNKNNAEPM